MLKIRAHSACRTEPLCREHPAPPRKSFQQLLQTNYSRPETRRPSLQQSANLDNSFVRLHSVHMRQRVRAERLVIKMKQPICFTMPLRREERNSPCNFLSFKKVGVVEGAARGGGKVLGVRKEENAAGQPGKGLRNRMHLVFSKKARQIDNNNNRYATRSDMYSRIRTEESAQLARAHRMSFVYGPWEQDCPDTP